MDPILKTGFELEFISPDPHDVLFEKLPNCALGKLTDYTLQHSLGTDISIGPKSGFGLEWRSKTWEIILGQPTVPVEVFVILGVLKAAGCQTSRRCGIHIHVSQTNSFTLQDLAFFEARITTLRNSVFEQRKIYAKRVNGQNINDHHTEISMKSASHFEIRVFNSTLNKRALRAYYNLVFGKLVNDKHPGSVG